jgi:hypothetical protein
MMESCPGAGIFPPISPRTGNEPETGRLWFPQGFVTQYISGEQNEEFIFLREWDENEQKT